ncbi:hypothetical protein [Paenibacillus sp. YYML68]|uniref:hypothetical protein n=1 Tax=Paenibacillus sp. YYML68 TaxID=2909250 RepID=UPI0024909154|nr:hypothetical protein [Paenibacillus sp. YYML68]
MVRMKLGEHEVVLSFGSSGAHDEWISLFPHVELSGGDETCGQLHIRLESGYGSAFAGYEIERSRTEDGATYLVRADYATRLDADYRAATIHYYDQLALKHALMHVYSMLIVQRGWGLLLHASCVDEYGGGHLFAGPSGAGKSTAAALSQPRGLYADEASIVKIESGRVTVYHSPFRSELHTPLAEQLAPAPLQSIQLLHQSLTNERTQMKKSVALLALMDKVFYWSPTPEAAGTIMRLLKQLVESVPTYDLYFRKDPTFWELMDR